MIKYLFIVIFVVFISGCSTTQPPVTEYRINSKIIKNDLQEIGCTEISLKVAQAFSSSSLMSKDMSYGEGLHKQFVFSQSQWADSPNRVITKEIVKLLRETKLFDNVQVSKSRSKNVWILETNIEDFMQYFNEDSTKSHASAVISFTLIDSDTSIVINSKTFESKVDVKTLDANGGVVALNEALYDVLAQSKEFFRGVCQ